MLPSIILRYVEVLQFGHLGNLPYFEFVQHLVHNYFAKISLTCNVDQFTDAFIFESVLLLISYDVQYFLVYFLVLGVIDIIIRKKINLMYLRFSVTYRFNILVINVENFGHLGRVGHLGRAARLGRTTDTFTCNRIRRIERYRLFDLHI